MTHEDAAAVLAILCAAYPTQAHSRSEATLSIYASALVESGADRRSVERSARAWIAESKFWPSIADLLDVPDTPAPVAKQLPPARSLDAETGLRLFFEHTKGPTL